LGNSRAEYQRKAGVHPSKALIQLLLIGSSLAQAELDRQFNLSLKNNILPNEFEKKIEEIQLCIKFNLETKYKIYYFLLYNICYFRKNKINFLNKNNLKFEELNELLFSTEEEIVQYYKKIRQYNLN